MYSVVFCSPINCKSMKTKKRKWCEQAKCFVLKYLF